MLALAIPFAPVRGDDVHVSWPRPGESAASTVAIFQPYRPLSLDVSLSCAALAHQGVLFSTFPPDSDRLREFGLLLTGRDQQLVVTTGGRDHALGQPPGTDCTYLLQAGEGRLWVSVDGNVVLDLAAPVPQIAAFVTDLPAHVPVSASARADARFQTSPTPLKYALLAGCVIGVLCCLVLGFRLLGATGSRPARAPVRRDLLWTAAVTLGVAGWGVLGAQSVDDGWFLGMHRNLGPSGFVGDYYLFLNASEVPASLLQHVFAPLFSLSWSPFALRLPAITAGIGIWLLALGIVRLLPVRLPRWLLAAAFAVAWMPGGAALRPEPFVALCFAVSAYAAVRATVTRADAWLLISALATGIALAITSTGILAAVPLVIGLLGALRRTPRRRWLLVAAVVAVAASCSPLIFAETGLGGFLDSAATRYWYGASLSWFHEFERYQMLLGSHNAPEFFFEQHPFRRLPILLAAAVFTIVVALRLRDRDGGVFTGVLAWPFAWLLGGLALLVFTPTKIGSHFNVLVLPVTLVLACGLALLPTAFTQNSAGWIVRGGSLFLIVLAVSVSFHGPNSWWGYHRIAMPMLDVRLTVPPAILVLIGVLAALAPAVRATRDAVALPARLAGHTAITLARLAVLAMPVIVVALLGTATAIQLQRTSWAPIATTTGCGIADTVRLDSGDTLAEHLANRPGPTLVDWPISLWYPCARFPAQANGLLEPPTSIVPAPGRHRGHGDLSRSYTPYAGPFAPIGEVATYTEITSRPDSTPEAEHTSPLLHVDYHYPVGAIDIRVEHTDRPGWTRHPSYADTHYTGQEPPP
ncbi:arabinosyltransferase domain-containing protein [Amycolatopsis sp. 195334CR]|uniref:arabinosyltransferase domain-containing protein n=1 Tax=Amycolatopsis sp. 195334CR TaxID=2814588 RepID=UPI001A8E41A2|nr:arabinosyltransferase domain-containing protein [Amycolatopsis sp. 195334CR]MBN6038469.1 arabinosyltransferase domain-containing protein [Amycolatopsis sp. 195334CR]